MRIEGIDIARFFAFVGMVLVNFRIAGQVTSGEDFASILTNYLEGRAAALFVILAGIGVALGQIPWHLTLRRALFLFVIGMIDLLIFEADILHFYALYFLVAILFGRAGAMGTILGALGFVLVGAIGLLVFDYEQGWNWDTLAYADFWTLKGFLRHSFYNGWHPVVPWAGFLLYGMWLGQISLDRRTTQLRLVGWGTLAAIAFTFASRALSAIPDLGDIMGTSVIPPGPFYMLTASATATAALGLTLLATPFLKRINVARFLIAPGRQTLTLYAAHILLGMGVMEAMGWLDGSLSAHQVFWYSVGFCAIAALYGWLWSRKFRRGPLEALMRITTEGKT